MSSGEFLKMKGEHMEDAMKRANTGIVLMTEIVGNIGLHSLTIGYLLQAHLDSNDRRSDEEILRKVTEANDRLVLNIDELIPGQFDELTIKEARSRQSEPEE